MEKNTKAKINILSNDLHSEDGIKYIFAEKRHLDGILDILADAFSEEPLS